MSNHINLGPIAIRVGSKGLAKWGWPRLRIGGLSFWSRSNNGDRHLAAYHPRKSITWVWYVAVSNKRSVRGYSSIFGEQEIARLHELYLAGNPYCGPRKWYHRFWQPASRRTGQWHDYLRLPFGYTLIIGRQEAMWR